MIKQLWWVALAAGLACNGSGHGSAGANDDGARARGAGTEAPGNTTDLPPGGIEPAQFAHGQFADGQGANARDELNLLETENGLVVQIERDGQLIERSCAGTCYDVCKGCLLEACQFSGAAALCNAAADTCEHRCNVCAGVGTQVGTCDMPGCAGDLSCYFATVGVPEEFLDAVRGGSPELVSPQPASPPPGASDPERAATPVDPNAADESAGEPSAAPNSGEGNASGQY